MSLKKNNYFLTLKVCIMRKYDYTRIIFGCTFIWWDEIISI